MSLVSHLPPLVLRVHIGIMINKHAQDFPASLDSRPVQRRPTLGIFLVNTTTPGRQNWEGEKCKLIFDEVFSM